MREQLWTPHRPHTEFIRPGWRKGKEINGVPVEGVGVEPKLSGDKRWRDNNGIDMNEKMKKG